MSKRYRDPTLSINCRAQHGMPHRPHEARCTGCSCGCHAVRPPADFRARVQAAKAAADRTPDGDQ